MKTHGSHRGARHRTLAVRAVCAGVAVAWSVGAGAATAPTADWRESVRSLAAERFRQPAWGHSHSTRVYALARQLAAADGVALDDDVVYAAAYLHDMAAFPPWADASKDHADIAADVVHTVLIERGFPAQKLDAVRAAIRTHMFFRDPTSAPESLYIHDADALDWLGAIGVARLLALVDPNGGMPDGPAMAAKLEENLAQVPARVLSPAGRALLPERRDALARFLQELREQTDDYRAL